MMSTPTNLEEFKVLEVIFGLNNSWQSRVIRFRTHGTWSHVGLVDGDHVIEAIGGLFVCRTPMNDFLARYTETQTLLTMGDIEVARRVIGQKFDSAGIFGLFVHYTKAQDPNKWFCSELVARASYSIRDEFAHLATPLTIEMICYPSLEVLTNTFEGRAPLEQQFNFST